jgi:hypothetical protein
MKRIPVLAALALLAVPAAAGAKSPAQSDRQNAAAYCKADREAKGTTAFNQEYGTNRNKRNAFGKCVSGRQSTERQSRVKAQQQCRDERNAGPAAFREKYGTNRNKSNAFGKCVSGRSEASARQARSDVRAAGKTCRDERRANPSAFRNQHGTNRNKSNAMGKCVSAETKRRAAERRQQQS